MLRIFPVLFLFHKNRSADVAIALGRRDKHSRFQEAKDVAARAKKKYGNVVLTGHSLGGAMAEEASREHDLEATVFNPGSNPFVRHKNKPSKVTVIRDKNDIISAGYGDPLDFMDGVVGLATDAHGLSNFL